MSHNHFDSLGSLEAQALGMVPMVIEQSGRGERAYDIYSRLLKERGSFAEFRPSPANIMIIYSNIY